MEKSVASGCNASQTVQEDENTQVECRTPIKKAGGSGRMKASRADGCVKIKVVEVSGRTCERKASFDEEKESVERKERESTCMMETEGYGDSDQNETILDGKDNKIKEDEKSVMENKMEQVPIMKNISVMEKEGDQKPIMENQTVMEKGGNQDTVMENQSVTEKGGHQDTVMENQSVMEKEGD